MIRVAALAGLVLLAFEVTPQSSAASVNLALPRSDYPGGSKIAQYPATNANADQFLGPAHRSSFERLGREDGDGWLQAALWRFRTGKGGAQEAHTTIFGYGINLFHGSAQAARALRDIKIRTQTYRVAHLHALLFQSSTVHQTLVFVFFAFRSVEVEAYYEYRGVAPASLARGLRHTFSRQASHLAHLARLLSGELRQKPAATSTPTPTATLTPSPLPTATPTLVATPTPTAPPRPSPTPYPTRAPTSTPTPTPTGFTAQASMSQATYAPGEAAVVNVQVAENGQPVAGAQIIATYFFPDRELSCSATTDATGLASCAETVPALPDGTQIDVQVQVSGPNGESTLTSTSFTIERGSP